MNRVSAKTYFEMEGKKGLQLIPLFFLMLLLTVALLGAAVLCINAASGKGGTLLRVDVAIAGGNEDAMTEKAVKLVQQMRESVTEPMMQPFI